MKIKTTIPGKKFFLFFLPLLLLFFILAMSFLFQAVNAQKAILLAKEKQNIEQLRITANDELKSVISDLFFLSVHPLLHQMLENDSPAIRQKVADNFKAFCSHSTLYDQIRFINEKGMERIRINLNRNQPAIVPENQLQNKGKRYYFADIFALEPGRIFMSPFDLNIEQGKIEYPVKPMIRFGTPVADLKGKKRGIVLLNYLGGRLIHNLKQALPDSTDSFELLNSRGYWLKGPAMEDEWGFMYKDRKNRTFAIRYPESWKKISNRSEGQFTSPQGIYTFTTVYLLSRGMLSSSGSARAFQASNSVVSDKRMHWKLVSLVTNKELKGLKTAMFLSWLPYLGIAFLLIVLISSALSLAVEEKLRREKMQAVLEMAGAVCHEFNQPLMIISGYSELLLNEMHKDDHHDKKITEIMDQVDRLGEITKKLMNITQYKTKPYLKGKIIDIMAASDKGMKNKL